MMLIGLAKSYRRRLSILVQDPGSDAVTLYVRGSGDSI